MVGRLFFSNFHYLKSSNPMNLMQVIQQYAEGIGGEFTDYDHKKSVIVVPLGTRYQTVLATSQKSEISGKEQVVFTSKVCEFNPSLDLKNLLEQHSRFDFSKFIVEDGFLKVEASCLQSSTSDKQVQEMIQEVASLADQFELKITGLDVH